MWGCWNLIPLGFLLEINQNITVIFFIRHMVSSPKSRCKRRQEKVFTQCIWNLVAGILFVFTLLFLCFLNLIAEKQGIYPLTDRKVSLIGRVFWELYIIMTAILNHAESSITPFLIPAGRASSRSKLSLACHIISAATPAVLMVLKAFLCELHPQTH